MKYWQKKLNWIMKSLRMTQKQLAHEVLKVSPNTLNNWVRGKHNPSTESGTAILSLESKILLNREVVRVGRYHCSIPKNKISRCYSSNGCYYYKTCEIGGLKC